MLPENIRNIAFIGHGGAGKTSLTENILFAAGEINRIGKIEEGNTVSDYSQNEIQRQFSISLSACHAEWKDRKINLIDSPGYSDFVGEVKAAVTVCDTGVLLVKSVEGIEVGTEHAFEFVKEMHKPSAIVINKCDNERSDYKAVMEKINERLSHDAVLVTFPYNQGLQFDTVIDVIKQKAYKYGPAGSKQVTEMDIPDDVKGLVEEYHATIIEKIAETNEELMNDYFEHGDLTPEEVRQGLVESITACGLIPVFAVSATKGVGINNFLDFVAEYFPSPKDVAPYMGLTKEGGKEAEINPDPAGTPVLFIFKVISEQHVGELSLFRVYSGKVQPGLDLVNVNNEKGERLSQIYILNGHNRKEVPTLSAGDIGAVVKLKDTHTNNTLAGKGTNVLIKAIAFPEAAIRGAIIPKAKGDEDKIAACLHTLHEEDPSFNVKYDTETHQTVIYGQGELQLSLAVKRLKERYGVEVDLVEPKVPYREAIKGSVASIEYKHKKQSGGRGQFAHVFFKMEPLPRGTGYEFVNAIVGGVVPGRFIPAVEKGIQEQMVKGVIAGYQVVDVKVTLFDGKFHDVDSDEMSFKLASSQCFKKGFAEAKPCLLEPIYEVEAKVPEECMGDVMGDLNSRRGKISGMDSDGHFQIIKANVPLSELYKYSSTLRSLTAGRGSHARKFSHYEEVPKEIEAKIIEEYKKSRQEEE